jgi:hypothetical protein
MLIRDPERGNAAPIRVPDEFPRALPERVALRVSGRLPASRCYFRVIR